MKASISTVSAAIFASALAFGGASAPAAAGGILSEIKVGVLDHDAGRDSPTKKRESDTIDLTGELLSVPLVIASSSTPALNALLQPRAHLGFTANTSDYTHTGYTGLTWSWNLGANFFADFAFGLAVNSGQLRGSRDAKGAMIPNGRPNLGSPVTFREGLDLGYRFDAANSLSVFGSHISHASMFAKENDGMNFLGLRYGYRFN